MKIAPVPSPSLLYFFTNIEVIIWQKGWIMKMIIVCNNNSRCNGDGVYVPRTEIPRLIVSKLTIVQS